MIKRANISWSTKQLVKMISKGTITFDNVVQRGFIWDVNRKSLLIHSILTGYPIPAFYAAKSENGYDMLDGKQRSLSLSGFFNNEFELTNIPEIEIETENGIELLDLNGKKFSDLSEDIKDILESYMFTIYYFDGITDDEIVEMFFRLNNGKPLSAIELTRVKAKSMETIKRIGSHELFTNTLTASAMSKYTNEDIVIKSYIMLHEEGPSIETKVIRPIMESVVLTEQDEEQFDQIYSRILSVHNMIENPKIAKKIVTRTHLVSIIPAVWKSIEKDMSEEDFKGWIEKFFGVAKGATISDRYNSYCGSGCAKKEAVKNRLNEIEKSFNEYFKIEKDC